MRKLKVALAAVIATGVLASVAGPAAGDPLPCKIFIRNTYVANNPLCYIHP